MTQKKRKWKGQDIKNLDPMSFDVTQRGGTEPAFQNPYWNHFRKGIYVDKVSGEPLFVSSDKFESGCGWPSFSRPIHSQAITHHSDFSHGMSRIEVKSAGSNSHLGHVFEDGPQELGGKRYCINSASLRFVPHEKMVEEGYKDYLKLIK